MEFYINDSGIQSAGACRNIGMSYAKGNWLLFADSDDYFMPGMYEVVEKYFESEYDMVVFTPTSTICGTNHVSNRHMHIAKLIDDYIQNPSEDHYLALTVFEIEAPWTKLIRKNVIMENHILFNTSLYGNDKVFSAKLGYYCKRVTASYETIYCVTRKAGSLTNQISEKAYDIRLNEYLKKCSFLREKYGRELCNHLHLTGAGYLFTAIQQRYGVRKYLEIIKVFHENNIPIIVLKEYSPLYIFKMVCFKMKQKKEDRKYYVYK